MAQFNTGKMSKAEFLKAISGLFQHAFTPENIKKLFEETGTWPIDRAQITADMLGPSEGLSGKSKPTVILNSPLQRVVELLENCSINSSQCPSPASQNLSLPNNPTQAPSPTSSMSDLSGFENTQAAFLFDSSPPSSSNAIPPINLHLPEFPELSNASSNTLDPAQMTAMTKSALIAQVQNLECDVSLLINHSQEMRSVALPYVAQVALLTLENKNS
jgi:hypothetical protein